MDLTLEATAPLVPAAHAKPFVGGIEHPALWLWDSWVYHQNKRSHLYCLALGRQTIAGEEIRPQDRNQYPFHIRHFTSDDIGQTWVDKGMFLSQSPDPESFYSKSVWSGDVTPMADGQKLVGFTGIIQPDPAHQFLQAIGVAFSKDGHAIAARQEDALSCPYRDYEQIIAAGYYLGPKDDLGANAGEGGGPILAWRDPFIFVDNANEIQLFWSAKISPKEGAVAHATLRARGQGVEIKELHPPVPLPDGPGITQAEVPKICFNKLQGEYYLLVSACNRLYEGQSEDQISKTLRLYKSGSIRGPWKPYRADGSIIPGLDHCFGASIFSTDFANNELTLICPLTELAEPKKQLSIAPIRTISV